jgi:predicted nucleotidyltransferase
MDDTTLNTMTAAIVEASNPEEVLLFGSHARGAASASSDVDFLVIVPDSNGLPLRRITGNIYRRLAQYPFAKDILVYKRSEAERWRGVPGHVVNTGYAEGRRLYGG